MVCLYLDVYLAYFVEDFSENIQRGVSCFWTHIKVLEIIWRFNIE